MEAFVYCWTDHLTNKLYVGSHKGSTEDGYICSSKYMMEEYNKRPADFTRQIVAEGLYADVRNLEYKILEAENAKYNPMFYNMHNGNGDFFIKKHTANTKLKMGKWQKGIPKSEVTRVKLSKANIGKLHNQTAKEKMSTAHKGKVLSQETKDRMSKSKLGNHNRLGYPIETPFGIFHNIADASKHITEYSKAQIGNRVRSIHYPTWRKI